MKTRPLTEKEAQDLQMFQQESFAKFRGQFEKFHEAMVQYHKEHGIVVTSNQGTKRVIVKG